MSKSFLQKNKTNYSSFSSGSFEGKKNHKCLGIISVDEHDFQSYAITFYKKTAIN